MDFSPVIYAIPFFFFLIVFELIYELVSKRRTYRLNDAITNINLGSLDQVSGIFTKIIKIGIYTLVFEHLALFTIEATWISFAILFVLYDLCYYWSHRMSHSISLFWGGHVVHHQSEDFNLSVALRQSSTQFIWSLPFYLPLALLGFSPIQFVFVIGWNLIYQFWIHTEHIDKLPRWFEWIMNTPSHHRVHHGRDPKYIDRNYAGVFIIWDRMFGTFKEEEERPNYGITKPLESWNPIYANFSHYMDLAKTIRGSKSFMDSLKILFMKPGWQPEYMGGYIAPYAVGEDYVKYNSSSSRIPFLWYIFTQFLLALGLISYFLFNQENLSQLALGSFVFWFLLTIVMFSLYFESKSNWAFGLEIIRLAIIPLGYIYTIQYSPSSFDIWTLALLFISISSLIWYISIRRIK